MFHIPIFKVVYSTTFTVFLVALLALLLVTPADAVFQSYINNQLFNVIIIGAAYLLTALVAGFIYATRIYATRTHLAALPRSARVPDDVAGTAIRRIVAAGQARAAAIAYAAHPRDLVAECDEHGNPPAVPMVLYTPAEIGMRDLPKPIPAFGHIAHPGWTAPSTGDLPGVQFMPVIQELPHLLEAKAVSLAPPDPLASLSYTSPDGANDISAPPPDSFAVAVLQRPASMDVRSYIAHLSLLGAITHADVAAEFVTRYERARFGGSSLTEAHFRTLMNCFAALLRGLSSPNPERLQDLARTSSTSSVAQSRTPRSAPGSLHSSPSTGSLRQITNAAAATHGPPSRPTISGAAASLLQRIVTGGDVEVVSPPMSTPLPLDTPTPHATPFFTPYRSYVSSNDDQSTRGSGSGDSYDADRDSGESSESGEQGDGNNNTTITRSSSHRARRRRNRRDHRRRSLPLRSPSATALGAVGLGLQDLERDSLRSSADEQGWVSFDSDGQGRHEEGNKTETEDHLGGSDAGSVIRRYVSADPYHSGPLGLSDTRRRSENGSNSATASDAGSVVIRPEDRGVGGLLPIPVAATEEDESGLEARDVEMRMVDERR